MVEEKKKKPKIQSKNLRVNQGKNKRLRLFFKRSKHIAVVRDHKAVLKIHKCYCLGV